MHPFLQVQLRQRFRRPRQPPCSRPPGGKQGARKGCVRVFDRSHIRARGHAGRFVVKGISGEQAVMGICIRRAEGSSSHIRREMQKHNFFSFAVHRRSPHPASNRNTCNCKVAGSYLRYRTSTSISVRCKCSCSALTLRTHSKQRTDAAHHGLPPLVRRARRPALARRGPARPAAREQPQGDEHTPLPYNAL